MIRTTITLDKELSKELDAYIERSGELSGATSRSEAIRDLVRRGLNASAIERSDAECMGVVSYAIDQQIPGLAKMTRLSRLERHDEFIAVQSIPVNHRWTLDIAVMRSTVERVSSYAHQLFLQRGVRHGNTALLPIGTEHHTHPTDGRASHQHVKIQESF